MSLVREYNSMSGSDITAVIGSLVVGELQAISYNTTREKGPIYTMGSPDPRSFARGKRAVSGTLVFATFDHTAVLNYFKDKKFWANKADIQYAWGNGTQGLLTETSNAAFDAGSQYVDQGFVGEDGNIQGADQTRKHVNAWYPDQIPPFNVYIAGSNELGTISKKAILGVELMNEGGGVSVDDLMLAEQYTYMARGITPWTKVTGQRQTLKFV